MNLRDKFIWNVFIGLAFLSIGWYGWELFNNYSKANKLFKNFENEEVGTDDNLQDKVNNLEKIYKFRKNNNFIINENPFDLTRALLGGSESGGDKKLLCNSIMEVNGQFRANIKYKGKNYPAVEGNVFEWGKVLEVNEFEVIYIKNEIKKTLPNTSFRARIN
jgi:hypothetical protein